jgi:hypothetical protein
MVSGDQWNPISMSFFFVLEERLSVLFLNLINGKNHRCEEISIMVIDHDPRWSDTERKQKEKFRMHRLKSSNPMASTKWSTSV